MTDGKLVLYTHMRMVMISWNVSNAHYWGNLCEVYLSVLLDAYETWARIFFYLFWKYTHLQMMYPMKSFHILHNSSGIQRYSSEILNHIRLCIYYFFNLEQWSIGKNLIRYWKRMGKKEKVSGDRLSPGGLLFSYRILLVA